MDVSVYDSPSSRKGSLKNSRWWIASEKWRRRGREEGEGRAPFSGPPEKPIHIKSGSPKISRNFWPCCTSAVRDAPFRTFCRFIILSSLRRHLTGFYVVSRAWSKDDFLVKVFFRSTRMQFSILIKTTGYRFGIINYWSKIDWRKINDNLNFDRINVCNNIEREKRKLNSTIHIMIVKATNVEW